MSRRPPNRTNGHAGSGPGRGRTGGGSGGGRKDSCPLMLLLLPLWPLWILRHYGAAYVRARRAVAGP